MDRLIFVAGVAVAITASSAWAEVGLRVGPESAKDWQPQRSWLANPSGQPTVTAKEGVLDFGVPEAGKGMKWRLDFEPADAFSFRWLVVRYRLVNYAPTAPDYLVWCTGPNGGEGMQLLPPQPPPWDDRPHVVAFDLRRRGAGEELSALAIQCQAGPQGDAHVLVTSIELADQAPDDAEGDRAPKTEVRTTQADTLRPDLWHAHPDWLGNPTDKFAVKSADGRLRLEVNEPGAGMKWSADLPQPAEGMQWLSVRYRALNLAPQPGNYFLYLASEGGGKAPQEQYCVNLTDVPADGEWHVVTAPVTVPSIRTIALQVQAGGPGAYAEIEWLGLSTTKPAVALRDVLPYEPATSVPPGQQALALPEPLVPAADAAAGLEVSDWFTAPLVTVRGVTFALADKGAMLAATPFKQPGEITLHPDLQASELYLLLGARYARNEEPSYGGGRLQRVVDPHRCEVVVTYEDGMVDEFVPGRLGPRIPDPAPRAGRDADQAKPGSGTEDRGLRTNDYGVYSGIDAYVVGPLAGKRIKTVTLRDGMRNGGFYLAAVTANTGAARFAAAEAKPYRVGQTRLASGRGAQAEAREADGRLQGKVEAVADSLTLNMDMDRVLGDCQFAISPAKLPAWQARGPLFSVKCGDTLLQPRQFELKKVEQASERAGRRVVGTATVGAAKIGCVLTIASGPGDPGVALRLELSNDGGVPVTLQPDFPVLPPIRPAAEWGDTWYFFPRRGCVVNHVPIGLREAYSGAFPFQVESLFWPDQGFGLFLLTRDLDLNFRYFRLSKDGDGARVSLEYPTVTLAPGETWKSVDTVIGLNQGDWHGAWDTYRRWAATWYRPAAPRKAWFRKVFNFRQQFMHFPAPEKSGIFDDATKAYHFREGVEADRKAFGGVDYLHLFDWGWSEKFGRCGDYDHWEQVGSAEAFANAVAGVQKENVPVGLYLEGYLVDPESNYGKAHGAEYQLHGPDGKPYPYFAPSYDMCSAVPAWQDYLAGVYGRTREKTGAMGYYVDEMGFTDPGHVCHAKNHGHPVPYPPAPGQRVMMQKIREALGPEAALYTEESPPDVTSQYQDGSFTYNISSVSDEWSPTHLNLYRFTVPTFKTFEIITCDQPLGSNVQAVKRIFFSGEGIWLEGLADKWFTPETRATIARTHAILSRYAEAFTSDQPTPLVPTLKGEVYANEFPAGDGRDLTVWTLYNANPRTVRGAVLRVPNVAGARYVDAWNERPAEVRIEGREAVVSLEIGPRDVACVARVREGQPATRPEKAAVLVTDGLTADRANALEALLIGEGISVERAATVPEGAPNADLVVLDSGAISRSAFEFTASLAGRDGPTRPRVILLVRSPEELKPAHDAGADACFPPGFDPNDFRTIASRLIAQAHQR